MNETVKIIVGVLFVAAAIVAYFWSSTYYGAYDLARQRNAKLVIAVTLLTTAVVLFLSAGGVL